MGSDGCHRGGFDVKCGDRAEFATYVVDQVGVCALTTAGRRDYECKWCYMHCDIMI